MALAAIHDIGRRKYSSAPPDLVGVPAPYLAPPEDVANEVGGYLYPPAGGSVPPTASVHLFTTDVDPVEGTASLEPLYRLSYVAGHPGNPDNRDRTYVLESELDGFVARGYVLDGIEGYLVPDTEPPPVGSTVSTPSSRDRSRTSLAVASASSYRSSFMSARCAPTASRSVPPALERRERRARTGPTGPGDRGCCWS